ncbi:tetratricopeptide repeat protein [Tropicibacter sp. R16_0]|uniref:tetratricopeptide repeat protein n=1 Tax=Tropicibacter sp. R16_0 TaxID=2821102 RepID=UPI001AD9881E|nr:tetratricopeptide repeat protein [Tropicibacter sp. R16_0]MBO9450982.1 tetratricopeptide repeat protein [Tropicibacter sp. R16_0]
MVFPLVRTAAAVALAVSLTLPTVVQADTGAGSYLAGRQAIYDSDFEASARYYTQALMKDPKNPGLMENVILSQLALGQVERALPVAQTLEALGLGSQMASMAIVANLITTEAYDELLSRTEGEQAVSLLVDGLLIGWAHMGAGSVGKALAQFDKLGDEAGLRGFALYHKAMALASVGDFEGANAIFSGEDGQQATMTRRAVLANVEILSQLGRNDAALEMMADVFAGRFDPGLTEVADKLAQGETLPFSQVRSVRDGMAEVFFTIGAALSGEASDDYALIYSRMAGYLRPDHNDALLLSASLLENLGQYDLSVDTYKRIPEDNPDHFAAELGRAEALRRAAKPDAAIEVLEQLTREYPELPAVHSALGDLLRQQEEYTQAVAAYDKALEFTDEEAANRWFILYARGISHERLKQWPQAEADFRTALELEPDQPQVLNYLGYSLVEKQEKLDEALSMIERAVAARPDSGYIVDSLGWVLFRLGRYDEAVDHMERAVELMPIDPVVNDHLGDVYWAVGRTREAEFQWSRALSFIDPEDTDSEADPERIRRKLEVGLDEVLAEEGAAPLQVANDG